MKYQEISLKLKESIISGQFSCNQRIPNREVLVTKFSSTNATVQNAINLLISDSFLESRGRNGTFVTEYPPHLFNFGIAIPELESSRNNWDPQWEALCNCAISMQNSSKFSFRIYYGIGDNPDIGDTSQLTDDINNYRLSGIFFFWPNKEVLSRFEHSWAKIISIARDAVVPHEYRIWVDNNSLIDKALKYFSEKNRKRVALLTNARIIRKNLEYFLKETKKRKFTNYPQWVCASCVCDEVLPWVKRYTELMMQDTGVGKPDALIVMNSLFIPFVMEALDGLGLSVPDDVEVVSHVNFHSAKTYPEVLHKVGFSSRAILEKGIEVINKAHTKKIKQGTITKIQAIDHSEFILSEKI